MQTHHADTLRESLTAVLGAPPDPAPLQPEVLDIESSEGYRREHIKYQVSPGDWSYAYLLIPNNLRSPAPAVYCQHRQSGIFTIGKREIVGLDGDKDHAIGAELVKRGYVVFAPDAVGFGERRPAESTGSSFDSGYRFHQLALRLLRGETLLKKVLWDVSAGVDYLESRAEVDGRFIGFMGYGYGGKLAIWATAMDRRIRAAVAHSGVVTYREQVKRGIWFPPDFVVPRLMQVADLDHITSMIAPRPVLLSTVEGDPQSADAETIYQKTLLVYGRHGVSNRLTHYRYPPADKFAPHMRYNAYNWLDSWLQPF